MDISTFIELTLNEYHTFLYYDQFELRGTFKHTGKWKIYGKKLILYDCENNTIRPMPTEWKTKKNELTIEKVKCVITGVKTQIILTYNKE